MPEETKIITKEGNVKMTTVVKNNQGDPENHVLLVTFSSQGHINPMLRLGKRLASEGIHVTLATTEVARQRMLKFTSIQENRNIIAGVELLFFSDGFSLDYDRKNNLDQYMESSREFAPVNLSNLIKDHYRDCRKRLLCIVTIPFIPWVADVAADHGIPCALHWIQPCALFALYYRFFNKIDRFPTLEDPRIIVDFPCLPSLNMKDLPSFVLPTNTFSIFPKLFSELFQGMNKFKWVLGNSFYHLEKGIIDSMDNLCPIKPIGPLVPSSLLGQDEELDGVVEMWKSDASCIKWLDGNDPSSVIYVSFGSIVVLPKPQMEAIACALKETKRPFLWVVKPSEFPTPDGAGQLPTGFLEETKDQGKVVTWSPQTMVLSHPSVGCFLTHCGWNSTLETICSGIPLVAYPQWTDQPTNAKLITDVFKNGVRITMQDDNGNDVTSKEIKDRIEEVMVGPRAIELRNNSKSLKWASRDAVVAGGSSDENIKAFVREMVGIEEKN